MKTTYTFAAILVTTLFSYNATAKLATDITSESTESKIEVNIEAEILNNFNDMLATVQKPSIKSDVTKQLDLRSLQFQTDDMVQKTNNTLPKFKVVIAD